MPTVKQQKKRSFAILVFMSIVMVKSFGPVARDLYLSSIPFISKDLNIPLAYAQNSITVFVLGLCLSQLINGAVSDIYGRRYTLITGILIALVGSALSWNSGNINELLIGRFLQGLGLGGSKTITESILRDLYSGKILSKFMSYLSSIYILILSASPIAGTYIERYFGWRSNLFTLLILNIVLIVVVYLYLPETNQSLNRTKASLKLVINNIRTVINHTNCRAFIFPTIFLYGAFGSWYTSSPIIFMNLHHLTPMKFTYNLMFSGFGFMAGALLNNQLMKRRSILKTIVVGYWTAVASCLGVVASHFLNQQGSQVYFLADIDLSIFIFHASSALIIINSYAIALTPLSRVAGTTVAILATFQLLGEGLASLLMAGMVTTTDTTFIAFFAILNLLGFWSYSKYTKTHKLEGIGEF